MNAFEQLHPALQHHIVNSLGWRELRPFQEEVIPPVLAGEHMVVLAPTAGGKTEAATFPVLSRMLSEGWSGLSVLYICPIKALLNNLEMRLDRYTQLLGRRSAVWHGDVKASGRQKILKEPPDLLLTTPESLEVMLISRKVDRAALFANLRVVVVDEIHAFAGDDRGWHLLGVLERIARLSGRAVQRIGLSATVGNPQQMLDWLAASESGPRRVIAPEDAVAPSGDVQLDYVGSLDNAAVVISRLHRGEKRLVFIDSRARAEQLTATLKRYEVNAFVTHSSLSKDERHRAEVAFSSGENCVIVATSVLELGIDVGDLDRVIQIDSPPTVSSFLQRMGRTGRRSGGGRNCLFLATREESLLQAAALIELWSQGYVEDVVPPPAPYHVFAQQLMALALQEGGIGRGDWPPWIGKLPVFGQMSDGRADALIDHALATDIFIEEEGLLWFGQTGEELFGRRHFMELLSVITSQPLFAVRHGRTDLGSVHGLSLRRQGDQPTVLALAGQNWQVTHVDWRRKVVFVEVSQDKGRTRWHGNSSPLSFALCQGMKAKIGQTQESGCWSRRAADKMTELRDAMHNVVADDTVLLRENNRIVWWTFAGIRANECVAQAINAGDAIRTNCDNLRIRFPDETEIQFIADAIEKCQQAGAGALRPALPNEDEAFVKFASVLPPIQLEELYRLRTVDPVAVEACIGKLVVRL